MTAELPDSPERSRRPRGRAIRAELIRCDGPVVRAARAVSASLFRSAAGEPQAETRPDVDLDPAVRGQSNAGVPAAEAHAERRITVPPAPAPDDARDEAPEPPDAPAGAGATGAPGSAGRVSHQPDPAGGSPGSTASLAQPGPTPAAPWEAPWEAQVDDPPPVGLLEEVCPPLPHAVALTDHARGELPDWWD